MRDNRLDPSNLLVRRYRTGGGTTGLPANIHQPSPLFHQLLEMLDGTKPQVSSPIEVRIGRHVQHAHDRRPLLADDLGKLSTEGPHTAALAKVDPSLNAKCPFFSGRLGLVRGQGSGCSHPSQGLDVMGLGKHVERHEALDGAPPLQQPREVAGQAHRIAGDEGQIPGV